jgi:hypothetical protein
MSHRSAKQTVLPRKSAKGALVERFALYSQEKSRPRVRLPIRRLAIEIGNL